MSDEAVWEMWETHFSVLSECWVVGVFKGTREHEEPTIPASINNARKPGKRDKTGCSLDMTFNQPDV